MATLSTFTGRKDPTPSVFGERSAAAQFTPSTGQVAGAFVEEVFQGEGSLVQDIAASNIRRQTRRGNEPLTQDEWKTSDDFRQGLTYFQGMTAPAAKTLAGIEDDRENRAFIIGKASGLQKTAGFASAFTLGLFEPKNFAAGMVANLFTAGAASAIPTVGRLINMSNKLGKYKGLAARGAVEGGFAAALIEPSNIESSKTVQGDYTLADSLINLTLSAVLGAGLNVAPAKFRDVRLKKKQMVLQEFETAHAQMVEGRPVDVKAVEQINNAQAKQKAMEQLPKIEEQIIAKQQEAAIIPVKIKDTVVLDENGASLTVFSATTEAGTAIKSTIDGQEIFISKTTPVEGEVNTPVKIEVKNPLKVQGDAATSPENIRAAKLAGHDGVLDEAGNIVTFNGKQTKPIYSKRGIKKGDPKLEQINELNRLETQKRQSQADSVKQIDNRTITELQNKVSTIESTAYSDADIAAVDKTIDEFGGIDDQISLERELEFLQDDIATMREQGILTDGEISLLSSLDNIDVELDINENVLLNAQLCLLRG